MDLDKINELIKSQPKFREKQIYEAIFKNLIDDWTNATNLPEDLRNQLKIAAPLKIDCDIYESKSSNSQKAAVVLNDKNIAETVLMRYPDGRNTVCVSSQVGCPIGCEFCHTGKLGFARNLNYLEIIEQVLLWDRQLDKTGERVNSVVFMGMGEPFLNYENVIRSIDILNNKNYFNIGARKISVSTCGLVLEIKKFADEGRQVNLAISLHAPNDKLRSKLMPINKKYPIAEVLEAVDYYIEKTNRKVMFEYALIDGINDSEANAVELAKLMRKPLYMVNLIIYNQTGRYQASRPKAINSFKNILKAKGVNASLRQSFGQDIFAACGQLGKINFKN